VYAVVQSGAAVGCGFGVAAPLAGVLVSLPGGELALVAGLEGARTVLATGAAPDAEALAVGATGGASPATLDAAADGAADAAE
jgi:hypothetical protein